MVTFVCDSCQETLKKAKLDAHASKCRGARFSCVDCSTSFSGIQYRLHNTCITEVEKYQKTNFVNGKTSALPNASHDKASKPTSRGAVSSLPSLLIVPFSTPKALERKLVKPVSLYTFLRYLKKESFRKESKNFLNNIVVAMRDAKSLEMRINK